jgi:hypothetical protein
MHLRVVSFLVLVGALSAGCGSGDGSDDGDGLAGQPKSATETNVFRCGENDVADAAACDGGVEELPSEGIIECQDDSDCPDSLPVCSSNNICKGRNSTGE